MSNTQTHKTMTTSKFNTDSAWTLMYKLAFADMAIINKEARDLEAAKAHREELVAELLEMGVNVPPLADVKAGIANEIGDTTVSSEDQETLPYETEPEQADTIQRHEVDKITWGDTTVSTDETIK